MARPQSEAKFGFFPLPPPVTDLLLTHLAADDPAACTVLDPCAGEGVAIHTLAAGLGIPEEAVHAVEMASSRVDRIALAYPGTTLLGPASFHGTEISFNSFSLAYVNAPYSTELGGGRREELSFLLRAWNLVIPGGVVAMVCPEHVVFEWGREAEAMRRTIGCRLDRVQVLRPPAEHRAYREIVVLGVKRKQPLPIPDGPLAGRNWYDVRDRMEVLGTPGEPYKLPPGKRPKNWRKTGYTPAELMAKMEASPLAGWLEPPAALKPPSPPLPPGRGHVALILAAGDLDGLVWPEGEPPHVVRGTANKVTYLDEPKCEVHENEDGTVSQKDVYSQRIVLVVRAVSSDGIIRTFTDREAEAS